MKYEKALDIEERTKEVIKKLAMHHVQPENISCLRSFGSTSNAIARCHSLSVAMQKGMNRKGFYTLEFISERFDKMPEDEKIRIIIHELMHIPKTFGGGFRHHDFVNTRSVEKMFKEYKQGKGVSANEGENKSWW